MRARQRTDIATRRACQIDPGGLRCVDNDEIQFLPQDGARINTTRLDDGFHQTVEFKKFRDLVAVVQIKHILDRQLAQRLFVRPGNCRRMIHPAKDIKSSEMRGPVIVLRKLHMLQPHRVARHIAGFLGHTNHLCDQNIVKPGVLAGFELIDHIHPAFRPV